MKTYWKGIEELKDANFDHGDEFPHGLPIVLKKDQNGSSRRDFLKAFGFTIAGAAVAASCKRPITKAIPFLIKPEQIAPGKSTYYASSFYDGEQYQSILVKVRDGRPIKIEGNDLFPDSSGGTSGIVQGSVLELYDNNRYRGPRKNGKESSWEQVDREIRKKIKDSDGKIVLVSGGIISPSTRKAIRHFLAQIPNAEHIVHDPVSYSAMLDANRDAFGIRAIPTYRFDRADLVLSFAADFLGSWISPAQYAYHYSKNRKPSEENPHMSRHIQIESGMSMTGSNADERIMIKPSEEKSMLAGILGSLLKATGNGSMTPAGERPDIDAIVHELLEQKGRALVICGTNDYHSQMMVNAINTLLDAYGNTIELDHVLNTLQGEDRKMEDLVSDLGSGKVSGLIFYNANPLYDYHNRETFRQALGNAGLTVSLNYTEDETSEACEYVCPDHHYLESWNDAEPLTGFFSLSQPAIRNIFDTRQAQESLLSWAGEQAEFYDYLKEYWKSKIYPVSGSDQSFENFWNNCLHDGILTTSVTTGINGRMSMQTIRALLDVPGQTQEQGIEMQLFVPVTLGTGKHSNNPWLQETPDPVSKTVWDNFAAVSPRFANENSLEDGDIISINGQFELPVIVQPGQLYGAISVALGYGREKGGKASEGVGTNFFPLVGYEDGYRQYRTVVNFARTGEVAEIAKTQTHHSMEGRPLLRETTLEEYRRDAAAGNELHEEIEHHLESLYKAHEFPGHHWGLSVDLNSCTGCNACVVACNAENNVPVVGKTQVRLGREMHWIRIDRYYSGDPEKPEVSRQPVMCQHCDDAPCENVCPVAATTQSSEGLNQMTYNRCVGTRYCENNCPYKVRRFNFLDYTKADAIPKNTYDPEDMTMDLPRMVLNPDVTVRAKGVMEKCTLCVQRIQEKKLNAKLEGRPLEEGEIVTACQQVCPSKAITFGDLNNEKSRVAVDVKNPRTYHLLEELHTLPSVSYLTNIRNKTEKA